MRSKRFTEPIVEKYPRLAAEECFVEREQLAAIIRWRLTGVAEND